MEPKNYQRVRRAKTRDLFPYDDLSDLQIKNKEDNLLELTEQKTILSSYPQRIVLELTNSCNLNCVTCGRDSAKFERTFFNTEWFRIIDPILPLVEEVTLMGWGEPTIHPQFSEILSHLNAFKVKKYFCTNGTTLNKYIDDIFRFHVDIIAISIDSAIPAVNDRIRKGSNTMKIIDSLKKIRSRKIKDGLSHPYMNFVMTAMRSNLHELPEIVKLANEVGLNEVKVVYFTAFSPDLVHETLYKDEKRVKAVFDASIEIAEELGVTLKLPHIQKMDPAGANYHKPCFVAWRDWFIGSDGYVRPCMSTPIKFFDVSTHESFQEMWNSLEFRKFRETINKDEEMPESCKRCYQSSYANWNKRDSFIQVGQRFSPEWESR